MCPSATFAGRQTVETAVTFSVCQFTLGASFRHTVRKILRMELGKFLKLSSIEKDIKRLEKAENATKESTKKRRRVLKYKTNTKEQNSNLWMAYLMLQVPSPHLLTKVSDNTR